jgi:hypothetical protein
MKTGNRVKLSVRKITYRYDKMREEYSDWYKAQVVFRYLRLLWSNRVYTVSYIKMRRLKTYKQYMHRANKSDIDRIFDLLQKADI